MKVLLVGGTSSLAKVLVPVLTEVADVITAGRSNCDLYLDLGVITTPLSLPGGLDVVIHTAAHFGGKTAEQMVEAEKINVLGTLRVCQASVYAGVKHLVLVSSIYSQLPADSDFYSVYSLSKRHAEEVALLFCKQQGMHLTVLRPAQLYGDTDDFGRHQPFLYAMADKAEKGENIWLFGKNNAQRNFLHAEDLAQIVLRVIQDSVTGVYSCQFPGDTSISAIAEAANAAFQSEAAVGFLPEKEDIKNNIFPIDDTLYKKINYYPNIDIEEGMRRIAKYRKRA